MHLRCPVHVPAQGSFRHHALFCFAATPDRGARWHGPLRAGGIPGTRVMKQFALLGERRFAPFFASQFLGAFNDNVFKNALIITVAYDATRAADASLLVNLSAGLFILPFFLFSALAGQIADRCEKSALIRNIKLAEIVIMVLAAAGFLLANTTFLIALLFLMGTQSAFFGPVKYAILPQQLAESELVGGNALVESGTFLAILLGTLLGGLLVGAGNGNVLIGGTLLTMAVLGWLASRAIPPAQAQDSGLKLNWNVPVATWQIVREAAGNRVVFNAILGISWFWLYGALFLAQLPIYTQQVLGGSQSVVTLLLVTFSVGIGIGSLACEKLSGGVVELGLVPFGSIGLTVFAIDLALASPTTPPTVVLSAGEFLAQGANLRIVFDLLMAALFGGLYIVPLYALVQLRSAPAHRARVIAANNILNALFMVASALLAIALLAAGVTIQNLFLVVGLLNAAVAVYIYTLVPEFLLRFITWMLVRTVYRLELRDSGQIPESGGAVIVCNHVSFVDALILTAASRRPIRFIMDHRIFANPLLGFLFRTARCIPIAPAHEDEAVLQHAFDEAATALARGELVGIFPEGQVTGDGEMGVFKTGVERIVQRTPSVVVPIALSGLWGSFFSRKDGAAMTHPWRLITRLRSCVTLAVGEPLPATEVNAGRLRDAVLALRGERR